MGIWGRTEGSEADSRLHAKGSSMLQCLATHSLYKKARARLPRWPYGCSFQAFVSCFVNLTRFYSSFVWALKRWMHRVILLPYWDDNTPLQKWWLVYLFTNLAVHNSNGIIWFSPWFSPHLHALQLRHWGFTHRRAGPLPCFPGLPESWNSVLSISHLKNVAIFFFCEF